MTMDRTTRHFGRRGIQGWFKTLTIALGLIVVGLGAITVVNDVAPPSHAVAATAVQGMEPAVTDTMAVRDVLLSADDPTALEPDANLNTRASEPRECRPSQGIVNDCIFD